MIYVIGLIVNLSQRFNVVLTFLDQKTVSALGVCFKLIYCFVDLFSEVSAHSINELIEFDQIIVFSELLLDCEMLGSCGPVIHFPQIFFLQFFEGNEVILALFMCELGETYRT
jgi:hypothetical protein